jgi:hypothetical protein
MDAFDQKLNRRSPEPRQPLCDRYLIVADVESERREITGGENL